VSVVSLPLESEESVWVSVVSEADGEPSSQAAIVRRTARRGRRM
jgi:hypothetical protein